MPSRAERSAKGETEIAWVGGFYSGEGCCTLSSNRSGRRYANIIISNTHLAALERCLPVIGGKIYGPYLNHSKLSKKPRWELKLDSMAEVRPAVELLWPYLTDEKREQATRALDRQAANPPFQKRGWPLGVPRGRTRRGGEPCSRGHSGEFTYEYTDPQGRSSQKCRACQKEKDQERRAQGREKRAATE